MSSLRQAALAALRMTDPRAKARHVIELAGGPLATGAVSDAALAIAEPPGIPGRPEQPELVPPQRVKQRSMQSREGRAALIHALAHIEFNAINLALDAIWRFAGLPDAFYTDWIGVAGEEAQHFGLLADHLETLGSGYGRLPAHDGLWDMARKTGDDVLARIALVPRTLEARGLDASPLIRAKLELVGDGCGAAILDIILRDEIGHVAIGNRWYNWLCAQRGLDPVATDATLAATYAAPRLKGPFNLDARRQAGFSESELIALGQDAGRRP